MNTVIRRLRRDLWIVLSKAARRCLEADPSEDFTFDYHEILLEGLLLSLTIKFEHSCSLLGHFTVCVWHGCYEHSIYNGRCFFHREWNAYYSRGGGEGFFTDT